MRGRARLLLLAVAPVVVVGGYILAVRVLPAPEVCYGIDMCDNFDSGGVDLIYGPDLFTVPQVLLIGGSIWTGAFLAMLALFPTRKWMDMGLALIALAVVVALTLPTLAGGPALAVPCTTPGPSGPVTGTCSYGEIFPPDSQLPLRGLIIALAVGATFAGRALDIRGSRSENV